MAKLVTLHLDPVLRRSAENGDHNFFAHLVAVLRDRGHGVDFADQGDLGRGPGTRAITHMVPPPPGGLCVRRVYHYPFWAIEPSAERWRWHVAKSDYSAAIVPESDATAFYARWQKRLFNDAPQQASREGLVYIPLQGRIREKRSFQSCTPVDMIRHTLQSDRSRRVVAALHPKEAYSQADLITLDALAAAHPRLRIVMGQMEPLLQSCDYVVTMNSAAAFNAMFFGKPSVLLGQIDFHHICLKATPEDLTAFDRIAGHAPDFARYVYWFWQMNSVNAGHPTVRESIGAALDRAGW